MHTRTCWCCGAVWQGYALEFDWAAKGVPRGKKSKAPSLPTDWTTAVLMKQRVKSLKSLLKSEFGAKCKGCAVKADYVRHIQQLLRKPEAAATANDRAAKDEL